MSYDTNYQLPGSVPYLEHLASNTVLFEACSKKVAMSDSEWFNSGRTYKDVMQDAIEKITDRERGAGGGSRTRGHQG